MWTYKDLAQLAAHPAHAAAIESNSGRVCHRGCVLVRMARVAMQALRMKALLAALIFFLGALVPAQARDDGRYANEPLHAWFDQLASRNGLCCSFADGFSVQDVDWDTRRQISRAPLRRVDHRA